MTEDRVKVHSFFKRYHVIGAVIRSKGVFVLLCQKSNRDPLEASPFMLVFHYPDDPEETQWGWVSDLGSVRRLTLSPVYHPTERVLADTGHVTRSNSKTWDMEGSLDSPPIYTS